MGNRAQQFGKNFKQLTSKIKNPMHKEIFEHMLVVNSAIEVSADIDALVEHTGYSPKLIEGISIRTRDARLWIGRSVDDREWWDGSLQSGLALFIHACVAKGDMRRMPRDDGSYAYINSQTGNVGWEWKPPVEAGD